MTSSDLGYLLIALGCIGGLSLLALAFFLPAPPKRLGGAFAFWGISLTVAAFGAIMAGLYFVMGGTA